MFNYQILPEEQKQAYTKARNRIQNKLFGIVTSGVIVSTAFGYAGIKDHQAQMRKLPPAVQEYAKIQNYRQELSKIATMQPTDANAPSLNIIDHYWETKETSLRAQPGMEQAINKYNELQNDYSSIKWQAGSFFAFLLFGLGYATVREKKLGEEFAKHT